MDGAQAQVHETFHHKVDFLLEAKVFQKLRLIISRLFFLKVVGAKVHHAPASVF